MIAMSFLDMSSYKRRHRLKPIDDAISQIRRNVDKDGLVKQFVSDEIGLFTSFT